jgi:hypothetical protein
MSRVSNETELDQIGTAGGLSFAAWLAEQAGEHAARRDAWNVWLANKIHEMAGLADIYRARNPLEFDEREDILHREVYQ